MADKLEWQQKLRRDSFDAAISMGIVPGVSVVELNAYNEDIAASVSETVWPNGGIYVFPSDLGEEFKIASTNPADNQIMTLLLLDDQFNQITRQVQLDGTTLVTVPGGNYSRINGLLNLDSTAHLGVVRVVNSADTAIYSASLAADQRSLAAVFTVPNGKYGFISRTTPTLNRALNQDSEVRIEFTSRIFGGIKQRPTRIGLNKRGANALSINSFQSARLPSKLDLTVEATPDSNTSDISVLTTIILFDTNLVDL